jgi:hypothetical protein
VKGRLAQLVEYLVYTEIVGSSNLSSPTRLNFFDAGWSSPVARQAHNLKAAGSNPAPATNLFIFLRLYFSFFDMVVLLLHFLDFRYYFISP